MSTARLPIDAAHRAASSDAHAIGAVTGLTDALAGKAAVAHETALTDVHGIVRKGAGSASIGIGTQAARLVTSDGTIAIGSYSAYQVEDKVATAVGHRALFSSKGNLNSAFGYDALYSSNANANSAFGHEAARATTIGSSNCAFGTLSMRNNIAGSDNSAFGYDTLYSSNANANSAFGSLSLFSLTSGAYNCAFGYQAGRYNADSSANQTSSYGLYVGSGIRASVAGAINETVIGYNAIGGGSNTVTLGNASVVNWLPGATNKVAIGSTTLAFKELYMTDGTNNWKLTVDATGPVWTSL